MKTARELQSEFGIDGTVSISEIAPGYPAIQVNNRYATANIALHGAHVMAYQPRGQEEVLWLSRDAIYRPGKAIRGGIPICWPWFGPHQNASLPAHGFVRNCFWRLDEIRELEDHSTRVILSTGDSEQSLSLWPFAFTLRLTIIIGPSLDLSLRMHNSSELACTITSALHAYFAIGDIARTELHGFEGLGYLDQLDANSRHIQVGAIRFVGELDRIYEGAIATAIIRDGGRARDIEISKSGSRSSVVWNPWIAKSGSMDDFESGGYRHMVCIEASNAGEDAILLPPDGRHTLGMSIAVNNR